MKRYAFYMLVMAVAAVAACQKQPAVYNAQEPAQKTYTYTVNASINDVKSDYDADGKFSWSAGDAISVLFHKGDDNKFFTLTTTASGSASASFSGEIETGYVIGASDQTGVDKKIWALFPASTDAHPHTYTEGNAPSFYVNPETDFTAVGAHWSANMPMYDLLADEGNFSFKNLAAGYKLTFTNIHASINTVRILVDNNASTYKVSGNIPLSITDDEYKLDPAWGDEGGARTISFIVNVDKVNNSAVVYVPVRRTTPYFQPVVELYNNENDYKVLRKVAGTKMTTPSKGSIKRITIDTGNTEGTPPASINVDWSDAEIQTFEGGNGHDRIVEWKALSDADYIYFRYKFTKSKYKSNGSSKFYIGFNTDSDDVTGGSGTAGIDAPGLEALVYFYPWIDGLSDGNPSGYVSGEDVTSWIKRPVGTLVDGKVLLKSTEEGSYVYIEVGIPRASLAISVGATVKVQHDVQSGHNTAVRSVIL